MSLKIYHHQERETDMKYRKIKIVGNSSQIVSTVSGTWVPIAS